MKHVIESWSGVDNVSRYNHQTGYIDIYTPHALIQIAGFIKYKMKDDIIVYRGQTRDYGELEPSLYRNKKGSRLSDMSSKRRTSDLKIIIDELDKRHAFLDAVDKYYYEAILQHYGFKTRYIDFVDNIWVALVFSSLSWHSNKYNKQDELMHFDNKGYGYIYVLSAGKKNSDIDNIVKTDKLYEVVDLRKSIPSLYLRPHAQHGILIKKNPIRNRLTTSKTNMYNDIIAKLRIRKTTIIKWINNSKLLTPEFLFPSTYFDDGYSRLSERNIMELYNELLSSNKLNYKSLQDVVDGFGCVKRYTYDGTRSDYNHLFTLCGYRNKKRNNLKCGR